MAERLGTVLYWTGCLLAVFWLLFMFSIWSFDGYQVPDVPRLAFMFLPALALWLAGKWLRYTLSGYYFPFGGVLR